MTTVDALMSRDVVTVPPDTVLMDIRKMLHEKGFHHLLVVSGDELVGIISDRDVLHAISPFLDSPSETARDVRSLGHPARDMMNGDPITVHPDTAVADAASLLLQNDVSALPVVEDKTLVGIVTTKDLLAHYAGADMASLKDE